MTARRQHRNQPVTSYFASMSWTLTSCAVTGCSMACSGQRQCCHLAALTSTSICASIQVSGLAIDPLAVLDICWSFANYRTSTDFPHLNVTWARINRTSRSVQLTRAVRCEPGNCIRLQGQSRSSAVAPIESPYMWIHISNLWTSCISHRFRDGGAKLTTFPA